MTEQYIYIGIAMTFSEQVWFCGPIVKRLSENLEFPNKVSKLGEFFF